MKILRLKTNKVFKAVKICPICCRTEDDEYIYTWGMCSICRNGY